MMNPFRSSSVRLDALSPSELSRQLRTDEGGFLPQRRGILGCALGAAGSMSMVALYQMGILPHLPEPPTEWFDADEVDASEEAYSWLSTPDASIGLASYAATVVFTSMGGRDRAQRIPGLPLVLVLKTGADAAQALKLTRDQWTKHEAFCFWCLLAAGFSVSAAVLAFPEARAAIQTLRTQTADT